MSNVNTYSIRTEFEKYKGYHWSFNYTVCNGVKEEVEDKYGEHDLALVILEEVKANELVNKVWEHYLVDYDHLTFGGGTYPISAIVIKTKKLNDDFLLVEGWQQTAGFAGREIYSHPLVDNFKIVFSYRENCLIFSKC